MEPKMPIPVGQFETYAKERQEAETDKIRKKIIQRGIGAARLIRKWLYGNRPAPESQIPRFPEPLSHEEFIRASHIAFLAHDDGHLGWTKKIKDAVQQFRHKENELPQLPTAEESEPKRQERIGKMERSQLYAMIQSEIGRHPLSPGVKRLLVESRMLQEDFEKVVNAEGRLKALEANANTAENQRAKAIEQQTIDEHMACIRAQHPAVIVFNAAQAQSYFNLLKKEKAGETLGVVYWPLAAIALFGPYLEKGNLEKEGKTLCNAALASKKFRPILTQIKNVKKRYRQDMKLKKKNWAKSAKKAIELAIQNDQRRVREGKAALYPDLAKAYAEDRIGIQHMVEKSNSSLYRTFGSKAPDENETHFKNMADVHDILRTRFLVDDDNEQRAIRTCHQIGHALENHLHTAAFPLESVRWRHDSLTRPKENGFSSLILQLNFRKAKSGKMELPRAEVQAVPKNKQNQNDQPESARTPRWMFFKGIIPGKRIADLLGIPRTA